MTIFIVIAAIAFILIIIGVIPLLIIAWITVTDIIKDRAQDKENLEDWA